MAADITNATPLPNGKVGTAYSVTFNIDKDGDTSYPYVLQLSSAGTMPTGLEGALVACQKVTQDESGIGSAIAGEKVTGDSSGASTVALFINSPTFDYIPLNPTPFTNPENISGEVSGGVLGAIDSNPAASSNYGTKLTLPPTLVPSAIFDDENWTVSGTPTVAGVYNFIIIMTDGFLNPTSHSFQITIEGPVYELDFSSEIGSTGALARDTYKIELWSKAANSAAVTAIKGSGTPIRIQRREVSDIFDPVITSEAVLEVISETDLFWKAFYTANSGDWLLKLFRNGTTLTDIIWQGQNVTENYNEPYKDIPYKSQIRFSDFGDLDFLYYKPTSSTFYSGFQSLAEIIFNCTNKLEYQLDINEYTNATNLETWDNASIVEKSLLVNTFLDAATFRNYDNDTETAMTCGEVLKKVLYSIGCRITQSSGEGLNVYGYNIQRIEEMIDSNAIRTFGLDHTTFQVTTVQYISDLSRTITNGTSFENPTLDITPINQNQDLTISERYNKLLYTYTTQEIWRKDAELIVNNDFQKGMKTHNNTANFPNFFEMSPDIINSNSTQVAAGANPTTDRVLIWRNYNQSPTLFAFPGSVFAQGKSLSTIVSMDNLYMRTTGTESGDTADAQTVTMSNINISVQDNLRLKIKGKILKAIDYSSATSLGVNNQSALTAPVFHYGVKVKLNYDNGNKYTWFLNPTYPGYGQNKWTPYSGTAGTVGDNIVHRILGTKGFSNNTFSGILGYEDNLDVELDSNFFPENGIASFSFYFYIPRTEAAHLAPIGLYNTTLEEMSLRYVTDGDFSDEVIKNITLFTLTDAKEHEYKFNVSYGDGPADYCVSSFRYGVVSAADQYKITSNWRKISDASARTAADIFNMIPGQRLISSYQREIRGDYRGIFDIVNTLNINDGVDNKRYLIMGDNWDVKKSVHSLVLREITPATITILVGNEERNIGVQPPTIEIGVPTPLNAVTSIKSVSNSIVLNPPSTLTLQSVQTNYPG